MEEIGEGRDGEELGEEESLQENPGRDRYRVYIIYFDDVFNPSM